MDKNDGQLDGKINFRPTYNLVKSAVTRSVVEIFAISINIINQLYYSHNSHLITTTLRHTGSTSKRFVIK